jgi:hypothetical protein
MSKNESILASIAQIRSGFEALAVALTADDNAEVIGPIEAVRRFRAANPHATISDAVAALVPKGYNMATIRTQMSRQNDIGPKRNEFLGYRIDNVDPIQMTDIQRGTRVQHGKNKEALRKMARELGLPESGHEICYSPNGEEFTTHDYARAILKELNR